MPKIDPGAAPERSGSRYPAPFDQPCQARRWQSLGDIAGLTQFGVNRVVLEPGAWSSQRHWHTHEDEFVYVLEGELVMITDAGETPMRAGDSAGFKAGDPDGHHFRNDSGKLAVFLAVGGRSDDDACDYPDIDMKAAPGRYGGRPAFTHKDGTPY